MVFEGKNKDYGAYELRKSADSRHKRSFILVAIGFSLATALPTFINKALHSGKEKNVEVTSLSKINIEKIKPQELPKEQKQEEVKAQIKFVPPVIKPDDEVKEGEEMMSQEMLNEAPIDVNAGQEIVAAPIETVKEIAQEDEPVFQAVEQMPSFPGGQDEMMKYLSKNTQYPQTAAENGIQGTVFVQFVVDKNGRITDVKVIRGVDPELDKEAVRVAKSMPAWLPGKQNGEAVRVAFTMPVKFVLQ
jgi:TonB family C-terminal domain